VTQTMQIAHSEIVTDIQHSREVRRTSCCIVGGGPGGVILALLLARRGVDVTLLEAHQDFDRDFRGDTVHPSVLEILDQIGLAEPLHHLRHSRIYGPTIQTSEGPFQPFDFRRLRTRFPYIMVIPQTKFLEFLIGEAVKYPNFHLLMGANVQHLIEENGVICGVQYLSKDGSLHDVHAELTVGADGRFSRVRQLAGLQMIKTSPPIDVLWFRLPKIPGDLEGSTGLLGRIGRGYVLAIIERDDYWQIGFVFRKGHYKELREAGIEAFRRTVASLEPRFEKHLEQITDWHQLSLLSVESSRCTRWYRPGLLLIGDAAHVMSPVGGVGINYAIQDAVAAANIIANPLRAGSLTTRHLAELQRQREFPTRVIQRIQYFMQERFLVKALGSNDPIRIPKIVRMLLRIPAVSRIPARLLGFGINRPHVQED
jgi:2-polyprenyl-6-methoxyphenol hydroxylase-like FAD-dependent oxidoreductase